MKKSIFALLLVVFASLSFETAAQHRHYNRYRSYERNYSYRNHRPSLLRALAPRIIIAVPAIIIGRDRNYRRGYQQGRQDRYELERQRRYNERYGRDEEYNNIPQNRQQREEQPRDSKENNQYERRSNRNYDENNIEVPENDNEAEQNDNN